MDHPQVKVGTDRIIKAVQQLKITSTVKYEEGAEMRAVIKTRMKKIEEARKLMIAPHVKKQREINGLFKEQTAPLVDLLTHLDHAMLQFKKKDIVKAKALALEAKEKGEEPVQAVERTTRTDKGTTSLKKIWKGEVVHKGIVWRKYPDFFIVDQKKVDQMARMIQAERIVDGVRIYSEDILSTRT